MPEFSRVVATTIAKYVKGYEDETLRNRKVFAMLQKKGRIKYNMSGSSVEWRVRYRKPDMVVNNGEQNVTFAREDQFKVASLTYQGYLTSDQITKREELMNRGNEAIIKYYEEIVPLLLDALSDQMAQEIYTDDSAAGNTGRMGGIESFMGATQTINITSGAARAANAADTVGYPNDTYAGLSTVLGNYSGAWDTQSAISSTWPAGRGDYDYDFYSPVIVNYTSSAFLGSAQTWAQQCVTSIRYGLTHCRRNASANGGIDMIVLNSDLYRQLLDKYDSKEQLTVMSGNNTGLWSVGFRDLINLEGCDVTSEFGVPGAVGYGFNINQMSFLSMQDRIFVPAGPYEDETTRTKRFLVDVIGQFQFMSPRNFLKLMTLA